MKKYVLVRILRSLFSLVVVTSLAFAMVYTLVPRMRIFKTDGTWSKLSSDRDAQMSYENSTYEKIGYIDFIEQKDICALLYEDKSGTGYSSCMQAGNAEVVSFVEEYEAKGYTSGVYEKNGLVWMTREIPLASRIVDWFSNILWLDGPNRIQDANNPDLERGYYLGETSTGSPALMCSGCEYKYQVYVNGSFPFIHQNVLNVNFGTSYPTYANTPVLDVFTQSQGESVRTEQLMPNGTTQSSSLDLETCKYKYTLDNLDVNKFNDNYADCTTVRQDPSMLSVSAIMGILSLILSYGIALPVGNLMARKKGKLADKIGMAYIIFIIAVPFLAYIYAFKYVGNVFFGLPDKFPSLGALNWKSYVLPIISLSLPSIGSTMMWIRRYMIDQSTQDYVKFAKSKGLSQKEIFNNHIMRNAIIPIAQGIPSSIVSVISGALITEAVYAVPGMGKMLPDSISAFNNPIVITLTFIFTGVSIFALLAGDLLITVIDPRISLADNGGRK
ncbi:MAG: ABC transporter permease [Erysipelotrichaceae bacterium]|nr:ABC transporter permease [Erysipelotrichaceae bacterium]MBQ9988080.1 ABC transporter permease [Erysipelotrichales bacterium]